MKKLFLLLLLALLFPAKSHAAAYDYQYISQTYPPAVSTQGSTYQTSVTIKNTGTSTWNRDVAPYFRLGTSHPQNGASPFCPGGNYTNGWLPGCNRVQLPVASVAPGQTVTFTFDSGIQDYGGRFTQYFQPVVDGITWLPDIGIYQSTVAPAKVGTFLFLWYGPGEYRWNGTVDTPVGGHYSSNDDNVLRSQLSQIRDAGFDFVSLDWWDSGPDAAYVQQNATRAVQLIQSEFPTLKFSFLVEPRWDLAADQVPLITSSQIYNTFGASPNFQTFKGRPLLTSFCRRNGNPSETRFYELSMCNNNEPGYSFNYWSIPGAPLNDIFSMAHRFDNRACCPPGFALYPTYSQVEWDQQVSSANRETLDLLFYTSWNEYYERTNLEPHSNPDSSVANDYALQQMKSFLANWKAGQQ